MLTGHNYIVFLSGKYRGCDFPSHVLPPRNHHKPVCWYSMHRSGISASLSCVPDVHSVFGYPAFLHRCSFCFFFPDIFPCISRYSNTITSAWFSSAYLTIAPAVFLPSSVFRRFVYAIFPVSAQNHVPSGICGSVPVRGTSGLFHWDDL